VLGLGYGLWLPLQTRLQSFSPGDGAILLLGTAIWLSTYWIWHYYHGRSVPPRAARLDPTGPAWQPLPALPHTGVELLAADEIRKLVWSIGRCVSEDLTRHVDIARTVHATAHAGGMAVMHYQHVIHPREVWLWVDEATQDLAMHRLTWELQYSLGRAELPCWRACFREQPDPVTWEEGQSFSPLSLEGHRHGALVLLLTSGEGMAMAHDLAPERAALLPLLHALADWPQLAFVDVSHGKFGLARLLQRYGVRCIAPEEVPEFLGAEARDVVRRDRVTVPLAGDLKAWAAGLALCSDPVDDTSALALHHAMGLRVEPWAMTASRLGKLSGL
jgi:hypothetical protein